LRFDEKKMLIYRTQDRPAEGEFGILSRLFRVLGMSITAAILLRLTNNVDSANRKAFMRDSAGVQSEVFATSWLAPPH
jgi:hypothetical protein